MTDLLYQTDSYLREFDATVVAVEAEPLLVSGQARVISYSARGKQTVFLMRLLCLAISSSRL